jgi:hypothetical protein
MHGIACLGPWGHPQRHYNKRKCVPYVKKKAYDERQADQRQEKKTITIEGHDPLSCNAI